MSILQTKSTPSLELVSSHEARPHVGSESAALCASSPLLANPGQGEQQPAGGAGSGGRDPLDPSWSGSPGCRAGQQAAFKGVFPLGKPQALCWLGCSRAGFLLGVFAKPRGASPELLLPAPGAFPCPPNPP